MFDVSVHESLTELPADVIAQTSYPAQRNFFRSFDWFSVIYETVLAQTYEPRVFVVRDRGGAVVAALFCKVEARARTLSSMTCFYTVEYGPSICRNSSSVTEVLRALVKCVEAERPRWHCIDLRYLQLDCRVTAELKEALSRCRFSVQEFFQYENWTHSDSASDFASYFATRPSQLRNTINRKAKQCQRSHRIEYQFYSDSDDRLESGIADYVKVYNRSWKQQEPFKHFTPQLLRCCARLGILQLGVLHLDDQPVAAQIWLAMAGRSVIYKLAYDESFKRFSVGSMLSYTMFERAYEQGFSKQISYGIGSESYKRDWMTHVREIGGLQALNRRTTRGLIHAAVRSLAGAIRRPKKESPESN